MKHNNPTLVMALLDGKKILEAHSEKDYQINFVQVSKDGCDYAAVITHEGKSITRPYRRIPLDFDVLDGFQDIALLLAAFIHPEKDVHFTVRENGGENQISEEYLVLYKSFPSGKRVRTIEPKTKKKCD